MVLSDNRGRGALGASALPLFVPGKKVPFFIKGIKVPYFHGIEVPFLQNLSALFGQCLLTFEVLPRPLSDNTNLCLNNSSYPTRPHSIIVII